MNKNTILRKVIEETSCKSLMITDKITVSLGLIMLTLIVRTSFTLSRVGISMINVISEPTPRLATRPRDTLLNVLLRAPGCRTFFSIETEFELTSVRVGTVDKKRTPFPLNYR